MEFMVACNWETDLLDKIDYPGVKILFGGIPSYSVSSGRPSFMVKNQTREEVKEYIKRIHSKGWKFDYNINSTCMSNMEFSAQGYKKLLEYIEDILELGVDALTVSMPTIMGIINKHFPGTKINVSTFQKVDSVAKAQRFEELGADIIMLSEHVNRDFKLLSAIRKNVKAKLALIANVGCIYGCPNMHAHANSISHVGARGEKLSVFSEFYQANCLLTRVKDPVEFVKSRWIRPEDVKVYEDIGIDMLKILERSSSSNTLGERVKAYSERSYDGNIIDLMGQISNKNRSIYLDLMGGLGLRNMEDIQKAGKFFGIFFETSVQDLFYLDNKKIPEDFLQNFMNRDCSALSCEKCNYCRNIADTCMTLPDPGAINNIIGAMTEMKDEVVNGSALY
ncbi:MAG TPA: U32 family peptidase [Clostridia bacterium]|nr:U32 family peptidase [Clostridia bacterium]